MGKIRFEISKGEEIRYISHLDYAGAVEKAIRRAKLPVAYSEGFNPHMKLAFASALSVGVTSAAEYMDIEFTEDMDEKQLMEALSPKMPSGIKINKAARLTGTVPALMAVVNWSEYTISVPCQSQEEQRQLLRGVESFNQAEVIWYVKESPKGKKEINIKEFVPCPIVAKLSGEMVEMAAGIRITPAGSAKPVQVLSAIMKNSGLNMEEGLARICRTGLFIIQDEQKMTPMAAYTISK
jgi:radical SAM-linked protein